MSGPTQTTITSEAIGASITDPHAKRDKVTAQADRTVEDATGRFSEDHERSVDVLNYLMRVRGADGSAQRVDVIKELQVGLGFKGNDVDGKFGPKTAAAFAKALEGVDRSQLSADQLKTIQDVRDKLAESLNNPKNQEIYGHGKTTRDVTLYQALSNFLNVDGKPLKVTGKLDNATLAHLNAGHMSDPVRSMPADGRTLVPAPAPSSA